MDISALPLSDAAASKSTRADPEKPAIASDFETFLKMLTVQMQNQDPLNPTKAEDFAVQLATFSNVEQQVYTNSLLQSLLAQSNATGAAQFADWIGLEARAPTAVPFDGSTPVTVAPSPATDADEAYLVVRTTDGLEVDRYPIPLDGRPVDWTGTTASGLPIAAGTYSFATESWADGEVIASTPAEAYARVVEARMVDGATLLVLDGGAQVDPGAVTAVRAP